VGTYVRLPDRMLLISSDCTGLSVALGYCALVLAYPVRPRVRAAGILAGVAAIVAVNLLRLLAVVQLSRVAPRMLAVTHDYLFQAGMVLVALLAWTGWLLYAREHSS
jgi:exosortase/archaeosortase family protein